MTGSWQAEVALAAACCAAALWLARQPGGGRWAAAALILLAIAASLGALLFAGVAPSLGPAHDIASRSFATLGFATIAMLLIGGARWPSPVATLATLVLAAAGLVIPLAPIVLLAHVVASWRAAPRGARHALAAAAMAAVITGQLATPAGPARLDVLHLTLAAWAVALAWALGGPVKSAKRPAVRT